MAKLNQFIQNPELMNNSRSMSQLSEDLNISVADLKAELSACFEQLLAKQDQALAMLDEGPHRLIKHPVRVCAHTCVLVFPLSSSHSATLR